LFFGVQAAPDREEKNKLSSKKLPEIRKERDIVASYICAAK
jgi:hypothetical protein